MFIHTKDCGIKNTYTNEVFYFGLDRFKNNLIVKLLNNIMRDYDQARNARTCRRANRKCKSEIRTTIHSVRTDAKRSKSNNQTTRILQKGKTSYRKTN